MRFTSTLFASAALIAAAFAVDIFDAPFEVEAGKGYEITYGPSETAPTTFILRKGPSGTLANLTTLTNSATGGSYTWNVDRGLVSADDYALMIIQEGDANYWGPIKLTGGQGRSSSSVASSSATPTASSSSASAASTTGSASASSSASASNNSTVSSASLSSTGSATARSSPTGASTTTGSSGPPESTGAASSLGSSPLALVFGAVAAMAYLN